MRALREQIARVAQHDAHTLFTGEPGSGRELFARYLASQSAQSRGPFVAVMGGDLSDEDAQRAAARRRHRARCARARRRRHAVHQGARRRGSPRVSVCCSASRAGRVSADRPNVPTGRSTCGCLCSAFPGFERSETRAPRAAGALERRRDPRAAAARVLGGRAGAACATRSTCSSTTEGLPFRRFSVAAQNRLRNYPWPGNVRELKNMVKRLLILGGDEEISLAEVEAQLATRHGRGRAAREAGPARDAAARGARAFRARVSAAAAAAVRRQGRAAREARRHGAHAPLPQAALARRRLPPVATDD